MGRMSQRQGNPAGDGEEEEINLPDHSSNKNVAQTPK